MNENFPKYDEEPLTPEFALTGVLADNLRRLLSVFNTSFFLVFLNTAHCKYNPEIDIHFYLLSDILMDFLFPSLKSPE